MVHNFVFKFQFQVSIEHFCTQSNWIFMGYSDPIQMYVFITIMILKSGWPNRRFSLDKTLVIHSDQCFSIQSFRCLISLDPHLGLSMCAHQWSFIQNYFLFRYFNPVIICFHSKTNWFLGWSKRYFGYNGNTGAHRADCSMTSVLFTLEHRWGHPKKYSFSLIK